MSDDIFIKNIDDYNEFGKIRPIKKRDRTHISFICSKCHNLSHKIYGTLKIPFLCKACQCHISSVKQETRKKYKQTCLTKYGVENTFQSNEIKNKIIETNLKKYGVENVSQSDIIRKKVIETNLEKYGIDNYAKTLECHEKMKNTCLLKYGVPNYLQSEEGLNKLRQTNNEKYGVNYVLQLDTIHKKAKETLFNKYGVNYPLQNNMLRYNAQKRYFYNNILFDSGWELKFFIYLNDFKVEFKYQPNIKFEYFYNNKIYYYLPDFYVNGHLIEIKGDHFFEDNNMICPWNRKLDTKYNEKYKCMLKNNIWIMRNADLYNCFQYINNQYGKDYIKQFKRY